MKSLTKISIIFILILLTSALPSGRMEAIDTTKVGVEVGDWFVHQVTQGNDSWMGFLDEGEAEVGDFINTTVTGFTSRNVTIETEHNGVVSIFSMAMDERLESYILFNDWDYWGWAINDSWGWLHDALNNQSFLDEYHIVEGYQNYTTEEFGETFNSTLDRHIEWANDAPSDYLLTEAYHFQRMDWDKDTGVLSYIYVNITEVHRTGAIESYVNEIVLMEQGSGMIFSTNGSESSDGTSDRAPWIYSFGFVAIILQVRKRGKQSKAFRN